MFFQRCLTENGHTQMFENYAKMSHLKSSSLQLNFRPKNQCWNQLFGCENSKYLIINFGSNFKWDIFSHLQTLCNSLIPIQYLLKMPLNFKATTTLICIFPRFYAAFAIATINCLVATLFICVHPHFCAVIGRLKFKVLRRTKRANLR